MNKINMRVLRATTESLSRDGNKRNVCSIKPISDCPGIDNNSDSISPRIKKMLKCNDCVDPNNPKKARCLYLLETNYMYKNGPNGQEARKQAFLEKDNFGGLMPFICPHSPAQKYMFRKTRETAPKFLDPDLDNNVMRWTDEQKKFRAQVKEKMLAATANLEKPTAAEIEYRNAARLKKLGTLPSGKFRN